MDSRNRRRESLKGRSSRTPTCAFARKTTPFPVIVENRYIGSLICRLEKRLANMKVYALTLSFMEDLAKCLFKMSFELFFEMSLA